MPASVAAEQAGGEYSVVEVEHTLITMSDGARLAARMWLPDIAAAEDAPTPVPAILEYIPYRKRDFTSLRDSVMHRFFASHGYACIRVDMRGSGDSEGILRDEYLQQELDDGVECIRWIGQQAWCNGSVGMIGISWGGFNGLMIAAMQPPELKTIVSVCSSDDRYADDIHYMGGCLLTDNLSWASTMFAYNSCPPDPMLAGEKWREMWLERLEGSGLWLHKWLEHQHRDDYWKHASICEDYSKVQIPVYAVSGWADGYSNTVFRLLENLPGPTKGLVGAWGHKYPHMASVGPAIGFLTESLRWWDQWLKGEETGIMDEPAVRVWMQDTASPLDAERPGRWIAEPSWPAESVSYQTMPLNPDGLALPGTEPVERDLWLQSPLSVGLFAGKWYSYSGKTDLPSDQRMEDGGALVFDSPPLAEPVEILGSPYVELDLSVDKPIAQVAVRLSDVSADGKVSRTTYGLLNLTHRNGHHASEPLEPGKRYRVRVDLNHIAQRFAIGDRIRVAISSSYWPLAWPAPEPARITVYAGTSELHLPVRRAQPEDAELQTFPPADGAEQIAHRMIEPPHREWIVEHNLATNEVALRVMNRDMRYVLEDYDWEVFRESTERYSYSENRYDTVRGEVRAERRFKRGDWEAVTFTRTVLTSTRTHWQISATLDAYVGDSRIFSKTWDEVVDRRGV